MSGFGGDRSQLVFAARTMSSSIGAGVVISLTYIEGYLSIRNIVSYYDNISFRLGQSTFSRYLFGIRHPASGCRLLCGDPAPTGDGSQMSRVRKVGLRPHTPGNGKSTAPRRPSTNDSQQSGCVRTAHQWTVASHSNHLKTVSLASLSSVRLPYSKLESDTKPRLAVLLAAKGWANSDLNREPPPYQSGAQPD